MPTTKKYSKTKRPPLLGNNDVIQSQQPQLQQQRDDRQQQQQQQQLRPSALAIWITAARPHTLSASLAPCLVAWALTQPPGLYFGLWLTFCVTVQIGTNLHNDYADFVLGADTERRVGPARATARGWWSPQQTCLASTMTLSITFGTGVALLIVSGHWHDPFSWGIILSSLYNAFAYTGGPYPLGYLGLLPHPRWSIGYAGLGEIFVFLYFGLAATLTLPYLLDRGSGYRDNVENDKEYEYKNNLPGSSNYIIVHDWTEQWICAIQMGLLAINIIVVNNLRDRLTDVEAGKFTTAVRFGRRFCEVEYLLCNILAFGLVLVRALLAARRLGGASSLLWSSSSWRPLWTLLPLFAAVPALRETLCVLRKEGPDLNVHVGGAAKVQLLFALLVALGADW